MKRYRKVLLFIFASVFALLPLASCNKAIGNKTVFARGGFDGGIAEAAYAYDVKRGDSALPEEEEIAGGNVSEVTQPRAGQITAGAQDDNRYYSQWTGLFAPDGKFEVYLSDTWGMYSQRRVTVTVRNGEAPVAGASVVATGEDGVSFRAVTNANGVAYLFPTAETGTISVTSGTHGNTATFEAEHREVSVNLEGAEEKADVIELMFVVDVTGSMGDEIRYLQAELRDVIAQVAAANANATVNLAFLFYRDTDDSVPFTYVDFKDVTNEKNLNAHQKILAKQSADGGGDYPEAVDEALAMAISKQWSANATKLIFLVLDAPAHDGQENKTRFAKAVSDAAEKGIRICPVLASGADLLCEYTTRSAALLTGGTFVFITDDSGIGGEHYDPDLPNLTVEYLNACLVRLINGYHTGTFADPVSWRDQ